MIIHLRYATSTLTLLMASTRQRELGASSTVKNTSTSFHTTQKPGAELLQSHRYNNSGVIMSNEISTTNRGSIMATWRIISGHNRRELLDLKRRIKTGEQGLSYRVWVFPTPGAHNISITVNLINILFEKDGNGITIIAERTSKGLVRKCIITYDPDTCSGMCQVFRHQH